MRLATDLRAPGLTDTVDQYLCADDKGRDLPISPIREECCQAGALWLLPATGEGAAGVCSPLQAPALKRSELCIHGSQVFPGHFIGLVKTDRFQDIQDEVHAFVNRDASRLTGLE